jgi:hypothetical protein
VGYRLITLLDRIREAKGPFFVARLSLRVKAPITKPDAPDDERHNDELVRACRELGYDPLEDLTK